MDFFHRCTKHNLYTNTVTYYAILCCLMTALFKCSLSSYNIQGPLKDLNTNKAHSNRQ